MNAAATVEPPGDSTRAIRTVLVLDVAESVRLMERDESGTILRWIRLVSHVERDVLPALGGRMIESRGDSLVLDFPAAVPALKAAFDIQRATTEVNLELSASQQMLLRMGVHAGELTVGEHDVYGRAVNLAARLGTLAGPGEIVVSADVRDQLTATLDGDIEDLGECYLKHYEQPVRAYRVGPPGPQPVIEPGSGAQHELRPSIAVIPFVARSGAREHDVIGELLADEVISALARSAQMHVISRLSTTVLRNRNTQLDQVGTLLSARYVLSGGYRVYGDDVTLVVELGETRTGHAIWATTLRGRVAGIVGGADDMVNRLVAEVSAAVIARELERAHAQSLPTLETFTLLMSAIVLMHRMSLDGFARARLMLETVIERAPRQAAPLAWLARWHVLRVHQGWSDDAAADSRIALALARRALDVDPHNSQALATEGLVQTTLFKRFDIAEERYSAAVNINPNDSLAWLLKGTMHAFRGEGRLAIEGTERALRLSPLDPMRYYFDSLASTAALAALKWERAIKLAQRSLRANRMHASTLRALVIAQWEAGHHDDARGTVAELLRLEPTLTVSGYVERSPSTGFSTGKVWANALRQAGVPE